MTTIDTRGPVAVAVVEAIHQGDTTTLSQLLTDNPGLATAKVGTDRPGGMARSLLHVATDWPGHPFGVGVAKLRFDVAPIGGGIRIS